MEFLLQLYQYKILPTIWSNRGSKTRAISISAAVVLAAVYHVYRKITIPPKSLRHLPTADNVRLLRDIFAGKPLGVFADKVTIPAGLNAPNGIYVRFDRSGWTVRIQHPVAIKKFLLKTDIFPKSIPPNKNSGTLFHRFFAGPNILLTNGEEWRAHRKAANPAFHRSMPVELFGNLANKLFKVMDGMEETVDFGNLMTRLTLDAIGLAGFGFDFNAIKDSKSEWVLKYNGFIKQMAHPLYMMFPILEKRFLWLFPKRKRAHDDMSAFLDMLDSVIEYKRQVLKGQDSLQKEHEKDLLTLMIESENKGEGALTNEQLKSDLCIFFVAGHDTTSSALAFAVYYLAKNPDIQKRARQEALSILGDGSGVIMPTMEQTKSMKYINCIIKETLRMNPPIGSGLPRIAAEDTELNGVFIPKGAKLSIDIYETHHSPRFWKDPEVFNPDRFADGGEASEKAAGSGYSWIPFGNGSRQCIGMNFSLVEQSVLLPLLLRKYEWSLPEDSIHKERLITRGIGLVMPKDLRITFKKRFPVN